MQPVTGINTFAAVDAAVVRFNNGRLDTGNAQRRAVIAFGAIGRTRSIVSYMQRILGFEHLLPDTIQAGVIAHEIADGRYVDEDQKHGKEIEALHEPR